MLDDFERELTARLDVQTRRLDLADLYSRLLREWLSSGGEVISDEDLVMEESASLDGNFDVVEIERDRLQQLREKFEAVVFTPVETDQVEIHDYLESLFDGEDGAKALERLRRDVQCTADSSSLANPAPFNDRVLTWCLKGLLANELLSDEKKSTLREFQQDAVARGEICDVLNMTFADIKNWTWEAGEEGIPIEPRRQLNGKYRIMMDEGVLEAIFLHYIGITWSVSMKTTLGNLIEYTRIWKRDSRIPQEEVDKRRYYLGDYRSHQEARENVEKERQRVYREDFFLSQLPASVYEGAGGYDDDEEYDDDDFERKSPKEIRQQLLRQLATELHLRRALDGEAAIVQSDFQWFGTALPHSTIIAVLRFVGIPEDWITFFIKFLEAPLNMAPVSDDPSASHQVRIRKRGVPMAHALEKFFGELVLFFLDLTVNQEVGTLLYRFHDDLWLCGKLEQCAKGWQRMERFAKITGLEFNLKKTGSVYLTASPTTRDEDIASLLPKGDVSIGFLRLDPSTGDWIINQAEVDAHVRQLQKQLSNCTSILSWVQTWNSCIGRFFSHSFGDPANCFGRKHVDSILATYKRMQCAIFNGINGNGRNVTSHLKGMIAARFGVTDIPDAFIFMPEQLGGLGLRNPFISCFLVRDNVYEVPENCMLGFLKAEKEEYEAAKREFEERGEAGRRRVFHSIYPDAHDHALKTATKPAIAESDLHTFMSFEEFVRWREAASPGLCRVYKDLMRVPEKTEVEKSNKVKDALCDRNLEDLDEETKWVLQFYAKELFEMCGELSIVDRNLLPLGILTILRKRKVTWQMVL